MEQLLLDLAPAPSPSRDNYAVGRNAEALAALDAVLCGRTAERQIYLWGAPGAGKSHLLQAAAREVAGSVYVGCAAASALPDEADNAPLIVLDDVDRLSEPLQAVLFDLYNRVRGSATVLLFSAASAPLQLAVRRDVATRLAWGWVFELHALSEQDALDALRAKALARGIALPDDVVSYVARRFRRDMRSLGGVLDAVERHALRTKRAITLPLLREALDSARVQPPGETG